MATIYKSTEALTIVKALNGTQVYVYRGHGVDGASLDKDDLARLVEEGYLVKLGASEQVEEASEPTTVKDILAAVGEDAEQAQAYLDAENTSEKPRAGLIKELEAVLAKAQD